ncbi:protein FAR-RED ELONGATED HYPOCOTYL 1-like isoform X2 [Macadamia integrifolia]|uniref:protein FAR-RED ELONGATED HYPOCOTYL 1-like isoform X2 n=1 Tax=Macadamia integrifolia TaxID=60698 RepID=UPI001C5016BB|nr:protein FAR-RED ELONGATED HYPOCOTYL 1-like isoform X2 [Macadamia integrifolia]
MLLLNSFHDYEVIQAEVYDLNKKRKLENEQLCFAQSKYKFGCRSSGCEHELALAKELEEDEMKKGKGVAELDENEKTLEPEYPSQTFTYAQSCTSLGSCSSNSLKDTLHYSGGSEGQGIVNEVAEYNHPNIKGRLQFGKRALLSVDQLEQFEEYAEEFEDMIVCSNVPSETDHFVLSSGKWSINQEAQQEPKGPTIDQEFEQYFSTLLL